MIHNAGHKPKNDHSKSGGGSRLSFMLIYTTPPEALRAAVEAIISALLDRALRPLPTTVFALEDIAAAHEASERGITGKVLIDTH
jgi:NADPH2:quinone reductase